MSHLNICVICYNVNVDCRFGDRVQILVSLLVAVYKHNKNRKCKQSRKINDHRKKWDENKMRVTKFLSIWSCSHFYLSSETKIKIHRCPFQTPCISKQTHIHRNRTHSPLIQSVWYTFLLCFLLLSFHRISYFLRMHSLLNARYKKNRAFGSVTFRSFVTYNASIDTHIMLCVCMILHIR